jgi:hypothetical protein
MLEICSFEASRQPPGEVAVWAVTKENGLGYVTQVAERRQALFIR